MLSSLAILALSAASVVIAGPAAKDSAMHPPIPEGSNPVAAKIPVFLGEVNPFAGNVTLGYVKVSDETSGTDLGWVNWVQTKYGEYRPTTDLDKRVVVRIDLDAAAKGVVDLFTVNGEDSRFPYLGAVNGYASNSSNLGPNIANYQSLAGTKKTVAGAVPSFPGNTISTETEYDLTAESAIWKYDDATGSLTPQYVNDDSTIPTAFIGVCSNTFALTGNKTLFNNLGYCGDLGATWVKLTFVKGS